MADTLRLITQRDADNEEVLRLARALVEKAQDHACVGIAAALVRRDGGVTIVTYGKGNRVLLLGAVSDLQYTLARSGDEG